MPSELLEIAKAQTLQYVLDIYKGLTLPIITSAFWSKDDYLVAAEPWEQVLTHGAHLIQIELFEPETAILKLQQDYEFSSERVALMKALFHQRIAVSELPIILKKPEFDALVSQGTNGIAESRNLLAAVGILLE